MASYQRMNSIGKRISVLLLSIVAMLFLLVSCHQGQQNGRAGMGAPKEYPVITIGYESTTLVKEYTALLKGQQTVEIRSRIAGYIEQILVDEGAYVNKGQVLFRLNDNDLQATVRSAEAQVKLAEADVYSAKLTLDKTKPLSDKEIVSKFDLQEAQSGLKAKEAQLAQARANLENAKANLQYAVITSPAEGTIGTFPYRVGSLVSSTSVEPLTSVSNTSKIYAYFSVNEKEFLSLSRSWKGNNLREKIDNLPEVRLAMADNTIYEIPGRIEIASGLVDQSTGSVNMRAAFPNEKGILLSGGSGSIQISQQVDSAILIPQKTSYELQGKHFVYVVGSDNKVRNTEIEVMTGNLKAAYIVTSGLKPGDRIVLEGITSLRNETEIKPKIVPAGTLSENAPDLIQAKH
jgi:membrane fusion protein, multidrug efflux system